VNFFFEKIFIFSNREKYIVIHTSNTQYTTYTHFSWINHYFEAINLKYLKLLIHFKYLENISLGILLKNPPKAARGAAIEFSMRKDENDTVI
jgi:hypothetical protein